ncbi:hypothetical protein CLV59_105196 [Chitinophaga dinghuensis]|uniref:Uncharacterized protein n=1 Tax=Chitinophaga dinghuensis TaxID=1539050 RepID=A0A327VVX7_9BACT|nr:hypothetical protein CLV59_105196 [Chitinophaga dinghuensis]
MAIGHLVLVQQQHSQLYLFLRKSSWFPYKNPTDIYSIDIIIKMHFSENNKKLDLRSNL